MSDFDKYIPVIEYLSTLSKLFSEDDKNLLKSLNDRERLQLLDILLEYSQRGRSTLHDNLKSIDFIRPVLNIEEFITDPYYLGKAGKGLYPILKTELIDIFTNNYVEIILSGSIGYGKSYISRLILTRDLYFLSCLRNPQSYFTLADNEPIVLANLSITEPKAIEYFNIFRGLVDASPYFNEVFPRIKKINSVLLYPNNISVVPAGSQETGIISSNIFACVADELNFMHKSTTSSKKLPGKETYDQAQQLYETIIRRIKSRFMYGGKVFGRVTLVSSARYPGDFTETREAITKGDPNVKLIKYATWDIKPASFFSGNWFYVFKGNLNQDPKILLDSEVGAYNSSDIIRVPEEYRTEFVSDINSALRDIAGVSIYGEKTFITNRSFISSCFKESILMPVTRLDTNFKDSFSLVFENIFNYGTNGKKLGLKQFPNSERYIHLDLAKNQDVAGFCMGCHGGYQRVEYVDKLGEHKVEMQPTTFIDMCINFTIDPDKGEINQESIKGFIVLLRDAGYPIKLITSDTYQNLGLKHGLEALNFTMEEFSVDRTPLAYNTGKQQILTQRMVCHAQPQAILELSTVFWDKQKNKVDHPPGGRKDLADCIVAVCHHVEVNIQPEFVDLVTTSEMAVVVSSITSTRDKYTSPDFVTADLEDLDEQDRFIREVMGR